MDPKPTAKNRSQVAKKKNIDPKSIPATLVKTVTKRAVVKKTAPVVLKVKATAKTLHKNVKVPTQTVPAVKVKSVTKPKPKKPSTKKTDRTVYSETVTLLPGTVSLRLREKKELYEQWFNEHSSQTFDKVARVFGYVFVITGLMSSVFITNPDLRFTFGQTAALPCSQSTCQGETVTLPKEATVHFGALPDPVSGEDTLLQIETSGVDKQVLIISGNTLLQPLRLNPKSDQGGFFTYDLPTNILEPGTYSVRLEGYTSENTRSSFTGPVLTLTSLEETSVKEASSTDLTSLEITEPELLTTTETKSEVDTVAALEIAESFNDLRLSLKELPDDDVHFIIEAIPTYKYETLEFFVRPNHSTVEFFLGQGELLNENWHYNFNGTSLPKGEYTLLAKGIDQGEVKAVSEISLTNKSTQSESVIVNRPAEKAVLQDDTLATTSTLTTGENHAGTTSAISTPEIIATESAPETKAIDPIVVEAIATLKQPISAYTHAVQANNKLLMSLSQDSLDEAVTKLVAIKEAKGYSLAELATFEIALTTAMLKEQALIRTLNTNSSAYHPDDFDSDGLTNFEEANNFYTSTTSPDTDDDGVMDGVEVMFGFNPNDSTPESLMRFASASAVFETLLGIENILPVAWHSSRDNAPTDALYAEINGFAIPDSYLVLVVKETEQKALVKADSTGKFSWLLERELLDGTYHMFAAYLNNQGKVAGKSIDFRFNKSANGINSALAIKSVNSTPEVVPPSSVPNRGNLVGAIGLVTFGFILLFLGRTLRAKRYLSNTQLASI